MSELKYMMRDVVINSCELSWVYKLPMHKIWVSFDDLISVGFSDEIAQLVFRRLCNSLNAIGEIGAVRADCLLSEVTSKPTYIIDLGSSSKMAILAVAIQRGLLR